MICHCFGTRQNILMSQWCMNVVFKSGLRFEYLIIRRNFDKGHRMKVEKVLQIKTVHSFYNWKKAFVKI